VHREVGTLYLADEVLFGVGGFKLAESQEYESLLADIEAGNFAQTETAPTTPASIAPIMSGSVEPSGTVPQTVSIPTLGEANAISYTSRDLGGNNWESHFYIYTVDFGGDVFKFLDLPLPVHAAAYVGAVPGFSDHTMVFSSTDDAGMPIIYAVDLAENPDQYVTFASVADPKAFCQLVPSCDFGSSIFALQRIGDRLAFNAGINCYANSCTTYYLDLFKGGHIENAVSQSANTPLAYPNSLSISDGFRVQRDGNTLYLTDPSGQSSEVLSGAISYFFWRNHIFYLLNDDRSNVYRYDIRSGNSTPIYTVTGGRLLGLHTMGQNKILLTFQPDGSNQWQSRIIDHDGQAASFTYYQAGAAVPVDFSDTHDITVQYFE